MAGKNNPFLWQEVNRKRSPLGHAQDEQTPEDEESLSLTQQKFEYKDPATKFQSVVEIPKVCAGLVFGKKRENLQKLEFLFSVSISVGEDSDDKIPLTIRGALQSDLDFVTRELETVRQVLPIDKEMIGFACGKQSMILKKVREDTEQIRVDKDDFIEFVGSTAAVQTAVMLMKVHLSYFDQFKALRQEGQELDKLAEEAGMKRRRRFPPGERGPRKENSNPGQSNSNSNSNTGSKQSSTMNSKSGTGAPRPNSRNGAAKKSAKDAPSRWDVPITQLVTF